MKENFTKEQDTLDAMIVVGILGRDLKSRDVFELTHGVAQVQRDHCGWAITSREADDVAKEICHRFDL